MKKYGFKSNEWKRDDKKKVPLSPLGSFSGAFRKIFISRSVAVFSLYYNSSPVINKSRPDIRFDKIKQLKAPLKAFLKLILCN